MLQFMFAMRSPKNTKTWLINNSRWLSDRYGKIMPPPCALTSQMKHLTLALPPTRLTTAQYLKSPNQHAKISWTSPHAWINATLSFLDHSDVNGPTAVTCLTTWTPQTFQETQQECVLKIVNLRENLPQHAVPPSTLYLERIWLRLNRTSPFQPFSFLMQLPLV